MTFLPPKKKGEQTPYNLAPAAWGRYKLGACPREGANCGARTISCLRWGGAQDARRSSAALSVVVDSARQRTLLYCAPVAIHLVCYAARAVAPTGLKDPERQDG